MMAAVDLSEKQFFKYCEIAYEEMFNNEDHVIDKQELIEMVCMKNMKMKLVGAIQLELNKEIDQELEFDEFIMQMIIHLKPYMSDFIDLTEDDVLEKVNCHIKKINYKTKRMIKDEFILV